MNAEFQRIARRDKKAFLSDQCKEIEGNNRMGKTRALFKKIRDTKGTFHTKIGSIKDRNGIDLTAVEDIKKRWQEYSEELYKKDLHDQTIKQWWHEIYNLPSELSKLITCKQGSVHTKIICGKVTFQNEIPSLC